MKKINNISKEKAQRILFITVLILVFGVFFISLSFIEPNDNPIDDPKDPIEDPDDEEPEFETILAPYTGEKQVVRKYYYPTTTETYTTADQEKSIFVMDSLYTISRGISYANNEQDFDVVASLSGTVKSVNEDPLYGTKVVIEHENDIVTEYWSLSTVEVAEGDEVEQGDVIGKSGESEYDAAAKNHVHFRILVDGKCKDPEKLIGKTVDKINE